MLLPRRRSGKHLRITFRSAETCFAPQSSKLRQQLQRGPQIRRFADLHTFDGFCLRSGGDHRGCEAHVDRLAQAGVQVGGGAYLTAKAQFAQDHEAGGQWPVAQAGGDGQGCGEFPAGVVQLQAAGHHLAGGAEAVLGGAQKAVEVAMVPLGSSGPFTPCAPACGGR